MHNNNNVLLHVERKKTVKKKINQPFEAENILHYQFKWRRKSNWTRDSNEFEHGPASTECEPLSTIRRSFCWAGEGSATTKASQQKP